MAGFRFQIDETAELGPLRGVLRRFADLGNDPTPLLKIAASVFEASTIVRFDEEKGPGGIPWPKSRRAAGLVKGKPPGKTLSDSGDLRDSILPGNRLNVDIRPYEIEFGSDGLKNPVKAIANQMGSHRQTVVVRHTRTVNSAFGIPLPSPVTSTVRGHGRMTNLPARPFIGFDEDDKRDLGEAWLDHLKGLFK